MDEGILIDVSRRFRELEEAYEAVDLYLAAESERLRNSLDDLEAKHASSRISYNAWCERSNLLTKRRDDLKEQREAMECALESCRDDMNAMQNEIRAASGSLSGKDRT